jgi:hypothetical protein
MLGIPKAPGHQIELQCGIVLHFFLEFEIVGDVRIVSVGDWEIAVTVMTHHVHEVASATGFERAFEPNNQIFFVVMVVFVVCVVSFASEDRIWVDREAVHIAVDHCK